MRLRWAVARRRRDEDGVIAVVVALVMCFVFIPLASFAVDIGMQRVATRDMQALADVVALDLARQIDGRPYSELEPNLQSWATRSADRNGGIGRSRAVQAELGIVDESKYSTADPGAIFTPVTSDAGGVPNAVRVTASTVVDFSLHGGSGGVARQAIARSQSSACFRVGSFALNLNSAKSALLNPLLNDALNLSVVSYTGLASANVSLLGLSTAMGLGSPSELFKLDHLSLNDLYLAAADALSAEGGSAANVALLNQLATASLSALPHIRFSDLVSMDSGAGSALQASINVLDLVAGSAFIANGTNALAIPSITAGVPNVAGVTASLHVIQAPILRCGHLGSSVHTSQVTLDVTATLASLNLLGLAATSKVTFHLSLADATGTLTKIVCGPPDGMDVAIASSLSQISSSLSVDLKLLGLKVAEVDGDVGTLAPAGTSTVSIRIPPNAYNQPVSSGSGAVIPQLDLSNLSITVLGFLGLGVSSSSVLGAVYSGIVSPIVNPLTTNLNNVVTGPLSSLLGLELGGADVFAVQKPSCNDVTLDG
ncbi:MAG TPA: hypothetical protein VF416_10420 [Marmoricola sp.]